MHLSAKRFLCSVSLILATAALAVDRPPQYVIMAFDNCTENWRWQELERFVREMEQARKPVHFTFFVSGANLIATRDRNEYQGPGRPRGTSNIGFGGSTEEVRLRSQFMKTLHDLGNELASHAVGHFQGGEHEGASSGHWNISQWTQEFKDWNHFVGTSLARYVGSTFADEVTSRAIGFRGPYLDYNAAMFSALKAAGFKYDTSTVFNTRDEHTGQDFVKGPHWPVKGPEGIWRFPLSRFNVAELGKSTLSMDYNFFVSQNATPENPRDDPTTEKLPVYQRQMLKTYRSYFNASYAGNRAPIHIGHHFQPLQHDIYNQTLKEFAAQVCGVPEVKCVSYRELVEKLEGTSQSMRDAWEKGDFPKAPVPTGF